MNGITESPQRQAARIRRLQAEGKYPPRKQRRLRVHLLRWGTEDRPYRLDHDPNPSYTSFTHPPKAVVVARRRAADKVARASRKVNRHGA